MSTGHFEFETNNIKDIVQVFSLIFASAFNTNEITFFFKGICAKTLQPAINFKLINRL